jgi:hypothetical protein
VVAQAFELRYHRLRRIIAPKERLNISASLSKQQRVNIQPWRLT